MYVLYVIRFKKRDVKEDSIKNELTGKQQQTQLSTFPIS